MSTDQKREEQLCRYWLWAIALLHLICLLLQPHPAPQAAISVPTHFASVVVAAPTPRA
jgi:hypothetical protein